ncbi:MAG: sulfotransferase domain-containing protein [Steroidobacteraceae bacterium]
MLTGSWAEHAAAWWRMREQPNVLFMTYERMRRDPNAAIAKVAEFIGVALTDGEFAAVAHKASLAFMKQFQEKFEPGRVVPWGTEGYMLRRGRSGGSAELLSPEIQARIDTRCRADLKHLGSDFTFDVEFGHGVDSEVAPTRSLEGQWASMHVLRRR